MLTFIAVAFPASGRTVFGSRCCTPAPGWPWQTGSVHMYHCGCFSCPSSMFKDLVTLGPSTLLPHQGGQASDLNCPCQVLGMGTWTPRGAGLWGSQTICALAIIRVMPSPRAAEASRLGNVVEVSPGASQVIL